MAKTKREVLTELQCMICSGKHNLPQYCTVITNCEHHLLALHCNSAVCVWQLPLLLKIFSQISIVCPRMWVLMRASCWVFVNSILFALFFSWAFYKWQLWVANIPMVSLRHSSYTTTCWVAGWLFSLSVQAFVCYAHILPLLILSTGLTR